MRMHGLLALALCLVGWVDAQALSLLSPPSPPSPPAPPSRTCVPRPPPKTLDDLRAIALRKLRKAEKANPPRPGGCSLATAAKRRNWEKFTKQERKAYLKAVKCMFTKPSTVDKSWAAGARVLYDDLAATHINHTLYIHGTGNFLTWHRLHTYLYEKTLRDVCGYKGHQPYWDWFHYQDDLTKNPVFDGSETSMGGNGAFFAHNGTLAAGLVYVPSGVGGGCVTGANFMGNLTINLGPIRPAMDGMSKPVNGTMENNARCLRRDLNAYAATKWHTLANLFNITTGPASADIVLFQDEFQGRPPDGFLGLHSGGHHVIGGDNSDNFSSVTDPAFYLHHAMVDQVYWIWQALHPDRARQVGGTVKARSPAEGYTQRTDVLDFGNLAPRITIDDALNTLGGTPFCYVYE